MLEKDRIDIAITTGIDGDVTLKKMRLDGDIAPVVELNRQGLYIYLNPKNSHLKTTLAEEIERMKKTGELDKIVASAEASL